MSKKKVSLSLCMIVRPADMEAKPLRRCLDSVADYVDDIQITITGENKKVRKVAQDFEANITHFEWVDDFSKARNFNFSQAEGDYILWLDADDTLENPDKLREVIGKMDKQKVDIGVMDYLYDFDEYGKCVVKHRKSQIVRNNGCVEWAGKVHEDFKKNREVTASFIKGIKRVHHPTDERVEIAMKRNKKIALKNTKENPEEPRHWWNAAKASLSLKEYDEAIEQYFKFMKLSGSDSERFLAWHRVAQAYRSQGDYSRALESDLEAIRIKPWYPDGYLGMGETYHKKNDYRHAKEMLVTGLTKDVPEEEYIVWNPRNYDFNPLRLLADCYMQLAKPKKAKKCLQKCKEIYPDNVDISNMLNFLSKEVKKIKGVEEVIEKVKKADTKEEIKELINSVPDDMRAHPKLIHLYNKHFVKEEASGKDVVFYCGYTNHQWNPETADTEGVGGSEEAVIQLTKRWADMGWNVTVYANCGHREKEYDGVTWKPFWMFNYRDKNDVVILWRHPKLTDYKINADKVFVDMHDVLSDNPDHPEYSQREFTRDRLRRIDKIFVKSEWQKEACYPDIPDDKFEIVPHGIDPRIFEDKDIERNPKRMIYTSSYDRGLETLLELFPKVKKKVPEAELHIFYGWGVWDSHHSNNPEMLKRKKKMEKKFDELEGVYEYGKVGQERIIEEYAKSNIWSYPTEFTEIFCITAAKTQALGVIPVTTNVAALDEVVNFGLKINSGDIYSDKTAQEEWIETTVDLLKNPPKEEDREEMREWVKEKFNWDEVAKRWQKLF